MPSAACNPVAFQHCVRRTDRSRPRSSRCRNCRGSAAWRVVPEGAPCRRRSHSILLSAKRNILCCIPDKNLQECARLGRDAGDSAGSPAAGNALYRAICGKNRATGFDGPPRWSAGSGYRERHQVAPAPCHRRSERGRSQGEFRARNPYRSPAVASESVCADKGVIT